MAPRREEADAPATACASARSNDAACLVAGLDATVEEKGEAGEVTLAFDFAGPVLDEAIAAIGHVPLPPYIAGKRAEDAADRARLPDDLRARGGRGGGADCRAAFHRDAVRAAEAMPASSWQKVTLHVGAGTFLPMKADDTADHRMHAEWGTVSAETAAALNAARAKGGRIVAVGTTSLRLLESAAGDDGVIGRSAGETAIFITPGYRFRAVDLLMTNFHLPRSTLFMLVSAFSGLETMRAAYAHAIAAGYRFYSYGDACCCTRRVRRECCPQPPFQGRGSRAL